MHARANAFSVRCMIAGVVLLSLAACARKSGEAVVLEKEHIAVAEKSPAASSPSPATTPESVQSPASDDVVIREMAPDEIAVDGYVMKKEVRGTSNDPRAGSDETWLIRVQLVQGGRRFNVHTDRSHYERIKVGDRIKVRYNEGNYTGTVWSADLED